MSAYIVDDITINKVISYLCARQVGNETYYPNRLLAKAGYDMNTKAGCEQLANDMFSLNVRAVEERYGDGEAKEFRSLDFEYHFVLPSPIIQIYKSLGCWSYQCLEGDVPESDLYKLMGKVKDALAHEIVMNSPAYRQAEWG